MHTALSPKLSLPPPSYSMELNYVYERYPHPWLPFPDSSRCVILYCLLAQSRCSPLPGTFFFCSIDMRYDRKGPIYCPPIELAPSSVPPLISAPSLSALRFLFSSKLVLLSANSFSCLLSTPVNQYPKLPPAAAKTGYAQSDSLLKKGRISIPSCQNRTARPSLHGTG